MSRARRSGASTRSDEGSGYSNRLDLEDEHVRKAVEAGVRLVIDSGAHHPSHLRFSDDFGVAVARRGGAKASDVLTTLPAAKLLAALRR